MKSVDGQPGYARADAGARTGCHWAVRSRFAASLHNLPGIL